MRSYVILALILVLALNVAEAREPRPLLVNGMTEEEVLKLWGEPTEKIVYEAKRQVAWRYSEGTVKFHQGRVIVVPIQAELSLAQQPAPNNALSAKPKITNLPKTASGNINDIFSEVKKVTPQDPDSAKNPKFGGAPSHVMNNFPPGRPNMAHPIDADAEIE